MKSFESIYFYAIPLIVFGPLFLYILWNFGIKELLKIPAEMRVQKKVDEENDIKFAKERERKRGTKPIGVVRPENTTPLGYLMQAGLYAVFALCVGYFATKPNYVFIAEGSAQIKLSISHPGQKVEACVKLSRAELARLPPNMRTAQRCGRERWPVHIEMDIDGEKVFAETAQAKGLSNDGPSIFYQKFTVPAGPHKISVRIRDKNGDKFRFEKTKQINIKGSQILIAGFDNATHSIVFK